MSLSDTDVEVVDNAIESATDSQLDKVVSGDSVGTTSPIVIDNSIVLAVAVAYKNNWPILNGSVSGNMDSWRRHYFPTSTKKTLAKDQLELIINKIKSEWALRQQPTSLSIQTSINDLDVQFSYVRLGGNPFVTFSWDFGDGETSTESNPSHAYADYGTYTVKCDVVDSDSDNGSTQTEVVLVAE